MRNKWLFRHDKLVLGVLDLCRGLSPPSLPGNFPARYRRRNDETPADLPAGP